jgi:hypothetical protein
VPIQALVGLTVGGVLAAPLGAYLARKVPARPLMAAVGLLVVGLAGFQIARSLKLIWHLCIRFDYLMRASFDYLVDRGQQLFRDSKGKRSGVNRQLFNRVTVPIWTGEKPSRGRRGFWIP